MHRTTLPLRLERVGFAARGAVLLSGLTLRVERQRRTVVIGPNGAGKSLLLRLCHGLLAPSEGRILCNGGTEGVGPDVRARQAMVFQRPVHLRRSAFANLTYHYLGILRGDERHHLLAGRNGPRGVAWWNPDHPRSRRPWTLGWRRSWR